MDPVAPTPAIPAQRVSDPTELSPEVKVLLQAFTKSNKDKPMTAMTNIKQAMISWSIYHAHPSVDEARGEKIAVPASLNEEFVFAMNETGEHRAT